MVGETMTRGMASLPAGVSGTTRRTRQGAARGLLALSPSNILYNSAGTEDTRDLRRIDGDGTQGPPGRSLEGSPRGQHHVRDFQAQAQPAEASPDAAEEPAAGALREAAPLVSVHSPVAGAGENLLRLCGLEGWGSSSSPTCSFSAPTPLPREFHGYNF